jgi:hypothetical protein
MRLFALAGLLTLAACGSDSTGPGEPAQVSGDWRFTWTMSGSGMVCVSVGDFAIQQSGSEFSGVQQGVGVMQCQGADPVEYVGETIINGELDGEDLSFRLGTISGPHDGTVTGSSIVGDATWTIQGLVLAGDFAAARLD